MLSDAKVRTAKPRKKPYKLTDSHRLYLLVKPGGSKCWQPTFRSAAREWAFWSASVAAPSRCSLSPILPRHWTPLARQQASPRGDPCSKCRACATNVHRAGMTRRSLSDKCSAHGFARAIRARSTGSRCELRRCLARELVKTRRSYTTASVLFGFGRERLTNSPGLANSEMHGHRQSVRCKAATHCRQRVGIGSLQHTVQPSHDRPNAH